MRRSTPPWSSSFAQPQGLSSPKVLPEKMMRRPSRLGSGLSISGPAHAVEVEISAAKMMAPIFILFPCEKINGRRTDGARDKFRLYSRLSEIGAQRNLSIRK